MNSRFRPLTISDQRSEAMALELHVSRLFKCHFRWQLSQAQGCQAPTPPVQPPGCLGSLGPSSAAMSSHQRPKRLSGLRDAAGRARSMARASIGPGHGRWVDGSTHLGEDPSGRLTKHAPVVQQYTEDPFNKGSVHSCIPPIIRSKSALFASTGQMASSQ